MAHTKRVVVVPFDDRPRSVQYRPDTSKVVVLEVHHLRAPYDTFAKMGFGRLRAAGLHQSEASQIVVTVRTAGILHFYIIVRIKVLGFYFRSAQIQEHQTLLHRKPSEQGMDVIRALFIKTTHGNICRYKKL